MRNVKEINFIPVGIETPEFTVFKNQEISNDILRTLIDVGFTISLNAQQIKCVNKCTFYSDDKPVIIIQLACTFYIYLDAWRKMQNSTMKAFIIPKSLGKQLSEFVLNTARGILHVETEGTIYNRYPIPVIDIDGQIDTDAMIPFNHNPPTVN